MDVAEDPAQPRLIELHVPEDADRINPEIERLAVAEREHVVKNAIVVWKINDGTRPDGQDMGEEAQVALIEDNFAG
jgi:hypothetical protein